MKNRRCPVCNKILPDPPNPFDPFCSNRCKMIDLSKWLNEEYRIHDNNR
ncbi:MAG: DNA gyrase inhibitor YacG [Deltaproteobacteria bacterium]|nr:DNA gyrase inhibitor YacG [Deltaproteobacteria bacterium]